MTRELSLFSLTIAVFLSLRGMWANRQKCTSLKYFGICLICSMSSSNCPSFKKIKITLIKAPAEEETIFQSTISLFKKTVQTLIMKRPNRSYIIIAVVSDLIMRLTFTGDIGTLYPYLTLPKFAFSRQDYGFLLGVRQLSQSLILLISYVWLIKSRRMESIIAQVCNVLFIIGAIGMFSTWYIATPIPLIWLSNVLSGVPRSNRSN